MAEDPMANLGKNSEPVKKITEGLTVAPKLEAFERGMRMARDYQRLMEKYEELKNPHMAAANRMKKEVNRLQVSIKELRSSYSTYRDNLTKYDRQLSQKIDQIYKRVEQGRTPASYTSFASIPMPVDYSKNYYSPNQTPVAKDSPDGKEITAIVAERKEIKAELKEVKEVTQALDKVKDQNQVIDLSVYRDNKQVVGRAEALHRAEQGPEKERTSSDKSMDRVR